ncbi:hypothetical protein [Streptomyces sp. NPDC001292]|uniref:hypothetical protein n=1 Tax=Streptomyces sp. NPDC001292 TaxID=3364558 RepID=UPI0036CACB2A
MLIRFACLAVTHAFAALLLLPMSDRDKDVEILALRRLRLLVQPDTVLRSHRNLIAHRHAVASRPKRPGRPRTVRSIRVLVLRLVRESPRWGYRRVHGELATLGIKIAASTVWEILKQEGIDPAPGRTSSRADFLCSEAGALLTSDSI